MNRYLLKERLHDLKIYWVIQSRDGINDFIIAGVEKQIRGWFGIYHFEEKAIIDQLQGIKVIHFDIVLSGTGLRRLILQNQTVSYIKRW